MGLKVNMVIIALCYIEDPYSTLPPLIGGPLFILYENNSSQIHLLEEIHIMRISEL